MSSADVGAVKSKKAKANNSDDGGEVERGKGRKVGKGKKGKKDR